MEQVVLPVFAVLYSRNSPGSLCTLLASKLVLTLPAALRKDSNFVRRNERFRQAVEIAVLSIHKVWFLNPACVSQTMSGMNEHSSNYTVNLVQREI